MSSAKFSYKNPFSEPSHFDWLSDTFLGTNRTEQKNTSELLNYQNQYNEYMQDKSNAFNEKMSNTAYQRAVQDMTAAGINPVVAFSGGAQAASSPSSAQASSSGAAVPKMNFLGSIIGRNTAKLIDSGINRLIRDTIDSDKKLGQVLSVVSNFV